MNRIIIVVISILLILLLGVTFVSIQRSIPESQITNFEECVAAGNPVMESYPRQCSANGQTFIENIGNENEKRDIIRIENPRPNSIITSPITISGQARGQWFFEASFPVKIYDDQNTEIASGIATTQGEWMTEDFVPFTVTLSFEIPQTDKGVLILEKSNASGLPEHDDSLIVPIRFR